MKGCSSVLDDEDALGSGAQGVLGRGGGSSFDSCVKELASFLSELVVPCCPTKLVPRK